MNRSIAFNVVYAKSSVKCIALKIRYPPDTKSWNIQSDVHIIGSRCLIVIAIYYKHRE